jgi:hypothetical protein
MGDLCDEAAGFSATEDEEEHGVSPGDSVVLRFAKDGWIV